MPPVFLMATIGMFFWYAAATSIRVPAPPPTNRVSGVRGDEVPCKSYSGSHDGITELIRMTLGVLRYDSSHKAPSFLCPSTGCFHDSSETAGQKQCSPSCNLNPYSVSHFVGIVGAVVTTEPDNQHLLSSHQTSFISETLSRRCPKASFWPISTIRRNPREDLSESGDRGVWLLLTVDIVPCEPRNLRENMPLWAHNQGLNV